MSEDRLQLYLGAALADVAREEADGAPEEAFPARHHDVTGLQQDVHRILAP